VSTIIPGQVARAGRTSAAARTGLIARSAQNSDIMFIMVDIDRFKSVNDTHGHAAGDRMLAEAGGILERCLREADTVVRWGGEEFLVIARHASRQEAHHLAERLRRSFAEHPFRLEDGSVLHRTCSLGFALHPFIQEDPQRLGWEGLISLADRCLYVAKRSGRNAWVGVFPLGAEPPDDLEARLASDLPGLVAGGHLEVQTSLTDPEDLVWDL
jgi:diguanylate cyclase (GGDEF)-like protein